MQFAMLQCKKGLFLRQRWTLQHLGYCIQLPLFYEPPALLFFLFRATWIPASYPLQVHEGFFLGTF